MGNSGKVFLDTDILVELLDSHDRERQMAVRAFFHDLVENGIPVISTQVLTEFFMVATERLGVGSVAVRNLMQRFSNMETVHVNPDVLNQAIDISILNEISFWDSLILASAQHASCSRIASGSLQGKGSMAGIEIVRPL